MVSQRRSRLIELVGAQHTYNGCGHTASGGSSDPGKEFAARHRKKDVVAHEVTRFQFKLELKMTRSVSI
jgi:hypothetical protein